MMLDCGASQSWQYIDIITQGAWSFKKKWCYILQMLFLLILPQSGQGNWGRERWNDLPMVITLIRWQQLLNPKSRLTNIPASQVTFWNMLTDNISEGINSAQSKPSGSQGYRDSICSLLCPSWAFGTRGKEGTSRSKNKVHSACSDQYSETFLNFISHTIFNISNQAKHLT